MIKIFSQKVCFPFAFFLAFFWIMGIPASFAAFTISSPASANFANRTVSTADQTTTVTAAGVTVNDDRGGSPGWTATIKATHLTVIRPAQMLQGNNNTVSSSGSYDGTLGVANPNHRYVLTITVGGAVGTAKFDVSGSETQTNITTGSLVSIGTKGVRADFDVATYVVNDEWQILVDTLPYTAISVSSGSITANSGSLTGVTAGSGGALSGSGSTSNEMTIMSATIGNGTGNYSQDESLTLTIHQNTVFGNFSGVATFTVV